MVNIHSCFLSSSLLLSVSSHPAAEDIEASAKAVKGQGREEPHAYRRHRIRCQDISVVAQSGRVGANPILAQRSQHVHSLTLSSQHIPSPRAQMNMDPVILRTASSPPSSGQGSGDCCASVNLFSRNSSRQGYILRRWWRVLERKGRQKKAAKEGKGSGKAFSANLRTGREGHGMASFWQFLVEGRKESHTAPSKFWWKETQICGHFWSGIIHFTFASIFHRDNWLHWPSETERGLVNGLRSDAAWRPTLSFFSCFACHWSLPVPTLRYLDESLSLHLLHSSWEGEGRGEIFQPLTLPDRQIFLDLKLIHHDAVDRKATFLALLYFPCRKTEAQQRAPPSDNAARTDAGELRQCPQEAQEAHNQAFDKYPPLSLWVFLLCWCAF